MFEVCLAGHALVTSEYILAEVGSTLLKKVKLPKQIVHEVIAYLKETAEPVEPDPVDKSLCIDKNDLPIIGTAMKGNAACIVTEDADLLELRKCCGINIITPREFWQRLR